MHILVSFHELTGTKSKPFVLGLFPIHGGFPLAIECCSPGLHSSGESISLLGVCCPDSCFFLNSVVAYGMFIFRLCNPGFWSLLSTFVTLGLIHGLLPSLNLTFLLMITFY